MCQAIGQDAVVGHQQQSGGVDIETSDREKPRLDITHHLGNRGAAFRIIKRGDNADRLVEQEINQLLAGLQRFAVNQDTAVCGIGLVAQTGRLAVHADPAGGYQLFSLAARTISGGGDYFLQALLHRSQLEYADRLSGRAADRVILMAHGREDQAMKNFREFCVVLALGEHVRQVGENTAIVIDQARLVRGQVEHQLLLAGQAQGS